MQSRPAAPPPPFAVGDPFPPFRLPDLSGQVRDLNAEVTGRSALLLLGERLAEGPGAAFVAALAGAAERLAALDLDLFVIGCDTIDRLEEVKLPEALAAKVVRDIDGRMTRVLLAGVAPARLFALDPDQRALAVSRSADPDVALAEVLAALDGFRAGQGKAMVQLSGAPVLLLPRLLPPETCRQLIGLWEAESQEGAVSAGSSENFYSDRKKNREHVLRDRGLIGELALLLSRRIGRELAKAFAFNEAYRFENFVVMGYDAERHYFALHRDRYLPEHSRRFAMSLNLNDDYEGGYLRFPEYSQDLYRPPAGGACVFSCSLLHEALPPTKGRRFVMTTFFNAAERQPAAAQSAARA